MPQTDDEREVHGKARALAALEGVTLTELLADLIEEAWEIAQPAMRVSKMTREEQTAILVKLGQDFLAAEAKK